MTDLMSPSRVEWNRSIALAAIDLGGCPCWADHYEHDDTGASGAHCCFREVTLDQCQPGTQLPCGHVPAPLLGGDCDD